MRVTNVLYDQGSPVSEENARSLAINEALRDEISSFLDTQKQRLYWAIGIGIGLVGFGLLIGLETPLYGIGIVLLGVVAGGGGARYVLSQTPDVTVRHLEKGYWTGYAIPTNDDRVVIYDGMQATPDTEFHLERIEDRSRITGAREELDGLEDFPVVMPHSKNVEEEFVGTLERVRSEIDAAEEQTVRAPVMTGDSSEARAVQRLSEYADADTISTDVEITKSTAKADIEAITELEEMAADPTGEAELEAVSDRSRQLVSELSGMQETAIGLLNDHIDTVSDSFGLVSYHFYCPDCMTDDIDSQLTLSDPSAGEWYCDTCRTRHETAEVVPRHRIKDDLVNPIWDQLWREKDDERRQIYENIDDRKGELREREFEQRREEIRTVASRINDIRSKIRDLKTQAKAAEGTVEEIGELMVKYERIKKDRKRQFQQDVEESFAEINRKTEQVLEETRDEQQRRIEEAEKESQKRTEILREEEQRRHAEQLMVQKQLAAAEQSRADARKAAELSQREEHHKQEMLLETRGKVSASNLINNAYYKKMKLLGASKKGRDS